MNYMWHKFSSGQELAAALSNKVAHQLNAAVDARKTALLAVSGGTTPRAFLEALSRQPIAWDKVQITLADERFVPDTSERSNARLAEQYLLRNNAAAATFIPLYHPAANVEAAASLADKAICARPLPLDLVVLGMGNDGHTASFFPDAANIAEILAATGGPTVLPVISKAAQEPRLTLSMATICTARTIILHIEGQDKKTTLEQALATEPAPPVRAVIERAAVPIQIYWTA